MQTSKLLLVFHFRLLRPEGPPSRLEKTDCIPVHFLKLKTKHFGVRRKPSVAPLDRFHLSLSFSRTKASEPRVVALQLLSLSQLDWNFDCNIVSQMNKLEQHSARITKWTNYPIREQGKKTQNSSKSYSLFGKNTEGDKPRLRWFHKTRGEREWENIN